MPDPRRALVVGHGTAGRSLAAAAADDGIEVVGFLDDHDDSAAVLGSLADVAEVLQRTGADELYFAIPSIDAAALREFIERVPTERVHFSIVPRSYRTLASERVSVHDLTDVDVLDLVGRRPVKHDLVEATRLVAGRVALVTGAAGSIGSRLVRHLLQLGACTVVCVDWWENGVFYLLQDLDRDARVVAHVGDVRDRARLDELLRLHEPELVFHAAAYKHVPLMQENPREAIANNVGGTTAVLEAAAAAGVPHVVYVSTDKAVRPVNVMGATKRLGEIVLADLAARTPHTAFTAVRFGNVIESNGSVLGTFRKQLAAGGPVTVTHEEVTRYFMTLDEAAQLIVQSAVTASSGEICVLDMGEPIRIMDLAQSLVRVVRPGTEIVVTGLRPGEKLHEELSYEPSLVRATSSEKIFVLREGAERAVPIHAIRALMADVASRALGDVEAVDRMRALGMAIR